MTAGERQRLVSTHSQRHILQIREIKAHKDFPGTYPSSGLARLAEPDFIEA